MKRTPVDEAQHALLSVEETDTPHSTSGAESHLRSVLKGVSWRFLASVTTMSIAWWITGEVKTALEIGSIEVFAKIGIYYAHERVWARIRV